MLRLAFTALVIGGSLFAMAGDSPPPSAASSARPLLAAVTPGQPDPAAAGPGPATPASSLPTDCPCAGECGLAEAARHRDE